MGAGWVYSGGMKLLLFVLSMAASLGFAAEPLKFAIVTTETEWPDGMASEVGDVEIVVGENDKAYSLWHESGKTYPIAKDRVKITTAEDAALRLMHGRKRLLSEIRDLEKSDAPVAQVETARDRMRARKAERAEKARQAQDDYIRWRLLFSNRL